MALLCDGHDALLAMYVSGDTQRAKFVIDPEGTIQTWNAGATCLFGYDSAEIIGQPLSTLYTQQANTEGAAARQETPLSPMPALHPCATMMAPCWALAAP